ncbi:putative metalloprotease with PDZ domain [Pontibacter ummariensis]|uniref:Predicted metalloprotease, contains C-terminal PDZ domain n=1 Tax=Pontibacter ummariensis TaxID=1610492 RepID=A0A239F8Q4_9BACT|nr:PDZ domain-containing protein [Pontibacter ummariensis]PRY12377.1 putative metalloprotease with PDZ domain [Pontibacter ummariensis]SNS53121.1 Predicted metalloprotease, contains C-terminal PDZ domain [Pontibacter ummariensis]
MLKHNRFKLSLLLIAFLCLGNAAAALAAELRYTLSMPEPHTHYFEVEAELSGVKKNYVDFTLPVWAPGSYLVREFAKNVEDFKATDKAGNVLPSEKIDKNTWRVYTKKADVVKASYDVYAYEMSVRTSFLDASHGYVNGTSVFMYPEGYQDLNGTLVVKPYKDWNKVSTGLKSTGKFTYVFPNYDILGDSPLEIGNHEVYTFTAAGVPHEVAVYGEGNFDPDRLMQDMKNIVEEAVSVMGELPVDRYVFIVHNLQRGGGGLEHLNSTTLQTSRWNYGTEAGYRGFLSLVAHEYFHLWNVKRLRPLALGPFDYNQENYTDLLWVSEGITSYYDDLIVRRAGYVSPSRYLDIVAGSINSVENTPGNKVQTVAESSFDAWIKYYRRNENSNNAEVSYYTKGGVIGHLLNMEIMEATEGEKSLDDVMRYMYNRYYKDLKRGFTEEEFKKGLEKVAGRNFDAFFRDYINGTKSPDYNEYFDAAGLRLVNLNANNNSASWGASTAVSDGKVQVRSVSRGSSAWEGGLNVNDEIIAVNGFRVGDDLDRYIKGFNVGDTAQVLISRDGKLQVLDIPMLKDESVRYTFEHVPNPTPLQKKIYSKWLEVNNS